MMNKIAIGTVIGALSAAAGGVAWYDDRQSAEHDVILQTTTEKRFEANVEITLELIEAKLKLFRTIKEHRELTDDEQAEYDYLIERRRILLGKKST